MSSTTDTTATNPTQDRLLRLPGGRRPVPTTTRLTTRRLPAAGYALGALLLFGGVVGGSAALGWWQTDCGGVNEAVASSGTMTPDQVKGSMTVEQITTGFPGVTAAEILAVFGAPADTPTSTQLKTLAQNGNGVDVTQLRTWLGERPPR